MRILHAMSTYPWWYKILSYVWPVRVERRSSAYNRQLDVDLWQGKLMLDTKSANYSFGSLHEVMETALKWVNSGGCRFNSVLMLGYGGGSAAEIVHRLYNPHAEIVGVEIDQTVIDLAEKWFYSEGVDFVRQDAFEYLAESQKTFDLIISDIFLDIHVPQQARTLLFYENLKKHLVPGGVVLQNLMLKETEINDQFIVFQQVFKYTEMKKMFESNVIFKGNF